MRCRLAFAVLGVSTSMALHGESAASFRASIRAGEPYVHAIGHGLYFVVDQIDAGAWNFEIKGSPDSKGNYTDCLGSPFLHGPGTIDLSAWRFAGGADAGWAESLPARKRFLFVTNAADQRYECAESEAVYASFQRSQSAGQMPEYQGLAGYKARPAGKGSVVITSVLLKPGLSSEEAEFRRVTLHVTVSFPHGKRARER
jgi:hypothetical protein